MATKKKTTGPVLNPDQKLGWHFLPSNMKLEYGDNRMVQTGLTLEMKNSSSLMPKVCKQGMHASVKPSQAAGFTKGPVLCRVLVEGDLSEDSSKFCGRRRTVIWHKELTVKDLQAAIRAAGGKVSSSDTKAHLVDVMGSYANDKLNAWLEDWAKKNGCTDQLPKTIKVAPVVIKPKLTKELVKAALSSRVVRTEKELAESLIVDQFENGASDLSQAISDLRYDGSVCRVTNYKKKSYEDGYVLRG